MRIYGPLTHHGCVDEFSGSVVMDNKSHVGLRPLPPVEHGQITI